MVSRAILEAQRELYVSGRKRVVVQVEELGRKRDLAIGQVNHFSGAIDAIEGILVLLDQLESVQTKQPEDIEINKEETNATTIAAD